MGGFFRPRIVCDLPGPAAATCGLRGPRAERHQTVEIESDRNQRHAGPARQTGQGHPGGAGAKRLESTRGVANAFREHANDLASGQYRFHRREGFHVASRIHACVDPSIDRNGARAPDDGAEHVSPKQGGLGQEPDGAAGRGLHERRVEQRVRVVGHQQHGAPGNWGAGSLHTIEQRCDETRCKPDAGTSRRGLHDRHPSGLRFERTAAPRMLRAALLHEGPARVGRRGPHFSGPSAGATLQG